MIRGRPRIPILRGAVCAVLFAAACSDGDAASDLSTPPDLELVFAPLDMAVGDLDEGCAADDCTCNRFCHRVCIGPPDPFPLEPQSDPLVEMDYGIERDANGFLMMRPPISYDGVWTVNSTDWGRGTVSKFDPATMRERARYLTVTCSSQKSGSSVACDGTNGCCAADDPARFAARQAHVAQPGRQQVQLMDNHPSRTGVDYHSDLIVANRAPGGQPSVTRIANWTGDCIDRNHNGKMDTSRDADGDGLIATDCNGDGLLDDLAGVKALPCRNNAEQEFFGLDDECVLWTTNVGAVGDEARALGLGAGDVNSSASAAWVALVPSANAVRLNGDTGLTEKISLLPTGCQPLGLVVDWAGVAWLLSDGAQPLCWLDTLGAATGVVRAPGFPLTGPYGTAVDRDNNVWIGGGTVTPEAYRYAPDRSQNVARLDQGWWTQVQQVGRAGGASGAGRGLGADARNNVDFWIWLAVDGGYVVQIPGSKVKTAKMDQQVDGSQFPVIGLPGWSPIAAIADRHQNILVATRAPSQLVRITVDRNGTVMLPDLASAPAPMMRCPAGDRCAVKDDPDSEPGVDNYSDFAGMGGGFRRLISSYDYLFKSGCPAGSAATWQSVEWTADVPPNTSLTTHARGGPFATRNDAGWGMASWTPDNAMSPVDLYDLAATGPGENLEVEAIFKSLDSKVTPRLKSLCAVYWCGDTK